MKEINLNGEVYVKKDEIKVDQEMVIEYLKNTNAWDFIEVVEKINEHHLEGEWADLGDLKMNGSSNIARTLLKIHYALK